jgi:multidrug efflux pump subunit AcrB
MIAWFARNHVAANLLMMTLLMLGLFSLKQKIPLEVFPSIDPSVINISVALPGSTPEDTEQGLSIRIEEAVQDLAGIKQIISRSTEGTAIVSVEATADTDPRELLNDIKGRVDAINTLPANAEKPIVSLAQHLHEVITVAISGPLSELEIKQFTEQVRDDLLSTNGITQVELAGVREYEIAIEISEQTLRKYNLNFEAIATAIRASSLDLSAGTIKSSGGDILLRARGQAFQKNDFENIIVLTTPDGSIVTLGDISTINDGFEESPMRSRFNGEPAALIEVYRIGDQSAIEVANKVKDYIGTRKNNLPEGIELTQWRDRSLIVKTRLQTLTNNALQGGLLVLLLLTLFLRPAIAFWVFIGIPVSFMGAFIAMPFFGVTLNIFSLFAFILVLGIVVDDAIVTGENIYTHMKTAPNNEIAAIRGTQEVAVPVTFGILTTIVAFLPLAFIEGPRGALFAQITVVVIPILLFSLIESKFVLPSHLKYIKNIDNDKQGALSRFQNNFSNGFEQAIVRYYRPILSWCLNNRRSTLIFFIGLLFLIFAMISSGWTRFVFFPRVQSEVANASLTMPAGTSFNLTDVYIEKITAAALSLQEKHHDKENDEKLILNIQSSTGFSGRNSGGNLGNVRFEITSPEDRESDITNADLIKEWRALIGNIPGAESLTFRAEIGRVSDPISIQFTGNDFIALESVAEQVKQRLAIYPAVFDIGDSLSDGKQELIIDLKPTAHLLGLTRSNIVNQIRQAFYGLNVQSVQRGRDDIDVILRSPLNERESVAGLKNMLITLPNNHTIPLSQVATFKHDLSPIMITRINRNRTVEVTADINKETANMLIINEELREFINKLLLQYPHIQFTMEGEAREQADSFNSLLIGLVLVLFAIYCLLAIPFKSYWQPFIVMSIIPFGVIGAVLGHWMMGMDISLLSIMGMLALVGVVVNDSLVLVDYINQHKKENLQEAILNAGVARFRPVILTSLTTFIGLMPLLFEESTQAQFLIPMAVSLAFGIIFATFITLLLVPVNYSIMNSIGDKYNRWINN